MNEFPAPPTMNMPITPALAAPPASSTTPAVPSAPVVPTSPPANQPWFTTRERHGERNGALVLGVVLVVVGGWLLLRQYFPVFELGQLWPVLLVGVGVLLVVSAFWRRPA
jgi:cell wall-active antibiotic response 4TMS protein YvqF